MRALQKDRTFCKALYSPKVGEDVFSEVHSRRRMVDHPSGK